MPADATQGRQKPPIFTVFLAIQTQWEMPVYFLSCHIGSIWLYNMTKIRLCSHDTNLTHDIHIRCFKGYLSYWEIILKSIHSWWERSGPVFCLLLGVSSDYAQPITGQVTEVTCPVIGRAQPELTLSKRQKMGPDVPVNLYSWIHIKMLSLDSK